MKAPAQGIRIFKTILVISSGNTSTKPKIQRDSKVIFKLMLLTAVRRRIFKLRLPAAVSWRITFAEKHQFPFVNFSNYSNSSKLQDRKLFTRIIWELHLLYRTL